MPPQYEYPLGAFHENELRHLDHFMDVAGRNDMYVMIPFIGGLAIAVQTDFAYSNPHGIEGLIRQPELREGFKQHMAKLITRVNPINGRKYSEDPTILSWMIIEEFISTPSNYPHGFPNVTASEIADWVEENAAYIKTLDQNHLVSINTTAAIDTFDQMRQDWKLIFNAPALDFIEVEDAEARILDQSDGMDTFNTLFSLNRPVVMMLSFIREATDQTKGCQDYHSTADTMRQVANLYLDEEVDGFTIFSWRANTYASPPYDECRSYSIDTPEIMSALSDISSKLGVFNVPPIPLDLVGLIH